MAIDMRLNGGRVMIVAFTNSGVEMKCHQREQQV